MAGNGPAPAAQHQRERDTKRRQGDSVTVTPDDETRGPSLLEATGKAGWSVAATSWYETWRNAPQSQLFESTDWLRLALLVPLVESYFLMPSVGALAEIRLNEERLGATYVDRQRAKIRIQSDDREAAPVTQLHAVARDDAMARMKGEI